MKTVMTLEKEIEENQGFNLLFRLPRCPSQKGRFTVFLTFFAC